MLSTTNEILKENLTNAKVIEDSINAEGDRVTTFEVTLHRFVLAELNTHRVFSRNSASSRAIPVTKQLAEFSDTPAYPLSLPAEKPGMQGGEELIGRNRTVAQNFLQTLHRGIELQIKHYLELNPDPSSRLHKSVINRYMEPWFWHRVIITATDWDGFFTQRVSDLAQPEIHYPALLMQQAYQKSTPGKLIQGEWHLPYVKEEEFYEFDILDLVKISTARCARVSYLTHDGVRDIDKDFALYDRLVVELPPHASPLEHPCRADPNNKIIEVYKKLDGTDVGLTRPRVGNFLGFMQARHLVLGF
jgi:hypothetical protein